MIIRAYTNSDRDSVMELLRLNTPEYFAPEEKQDLICYLDNHIENYYVVEEDGKILGCGGFNLSDDALSMRISWDIVHPESQGKGVGSKLTQYRIDRIKKYDEIHIISIRTTQLVYKFYEKFDFEVKEIAKDFWAKGFDLYRMERDALR